MHGNPDLAAQDKRIRNNLAKIKYPIVVMSGKGGVGKTTVSVNLASALAHRGFRVGIMDIDIHGPNVPKMLGIEDYKLSGTDGAIEPVRVNDKLSAASLGLLGYDSDQAIIWRGPMKITLIKQFLGDVLWGDLDYLIIDTPPGTGDEGLTVAQTIHNLAGAVIVSTPQEVSILDSRKSCNFAQKLNIPILGIVENMSGFVCPHCNTISDIFGSGGAERTAVELGLPFLGRLPLDPRVLQAGDSGTPFSGNSGPSGQAMEAIIDQILVSIQNNEAAGLYKKHDVSGTFKPER